MNPILLTHAYLLRCDPKQWSNGLPYPPLATLYAAAALRESGHDLVFHDMQLSEGPDAILPVIEQHRPKYFVICDDGFNYLTKMCLTNMRAAAFRMIALAKAQACIVIVSSSDASDHVSDYLQAGADHILIGEVEQTLCELIEALNENLDPLQVPGLAFMRDDRVVRTPARKAMKDLDALPLPAWDLLDIEPYRKLWLRNAGYFSINISTTRGCPFKCNWCAKPIYGNRYNARTPEHVVREIKWLQTLFPFDHVWFCDDIFGLKPGWVDGFARSVQAEGLSFRFKIQSRADLLSEEAVSALSAAGCEQVWMGAESGSQKILDAMDKGITVGQIATATSLLRKYNIFPCFFIQFGYLGETRSDIALTMQMINRLLPHEIGISVSYPLPGTIFYEKVKEQLQLKSNWTDSDELALMFHNTYPASFYKQLHRYVHRNYRKHLAFQQLGRLLSRPLACNVATLRKALSGIYFVPAVWLAGRKLKQLEHTS